MFVIGLDLSINSTGVCVNDGKRCRYTIIVPENKMTKTMRNFEHRSLQYATYCKSDTRSSTYSENELAKAQNLKNYRDVITSILKPYRKKVDYVVMEGVSYGSGSQSSLVDLAGLQYIVRMVCFDLGITFRVVSPTSNKKLATGNGNADKEEMVYAWLKCDPTLKGVQGLKLDDIADAYFLSIHYRENAAAV